MTQDPKERSTLAEFVDLYMGSLPVDPRQRKVAALLAVIGLAMILAGGAGETLAAVVLLIAFVALALWAFRMKQQWQRRQGSDTEEPDHRQP